MKKGDKVVMNDFDEKVLNFTIALQDVYKEEEKRELSAFPKLEIGKDFTEDFTAMLLTLSVLHTLFTGEDTDLVGFTHLLNRLAIQQVMKEKGMEV